MRGLPSLGRFFRLSLRLHSSWIIAFIFITAMMVTQFPEAYPFWERIVFGIVAGLLFFAAVSMREVILNLLALDRGIPVRRITLFIFGGVSHVAREETSPILESLLALAGLLCNLIIAGIFYGVHAALAHTGNVLINGLILWSAFMYLMLSFFHFIPAFPLDGGRLLLALLWKVTGDYDRATGIVSRAGQGLGLLFIAGGILLLALAHQWFNGVALAFIGWVLYTAAVQSRRPMIMHRVLRGTMARDVVAGDCPLISRGLSLGQLVRGYMLATGQRYFIVADEVRLQGIVDMRNIKRVPKDRWDSTTIGEIMTPASELRTAQAKQPAASLLEQMNEWQIDYMPVLERHRVIGIVARDSLTRLAKTRAELEK